MKEIMNKLNVISIISWIIAMIMVGAIWYLSMNDVSFRLAWNDMRRFCNSESIIELFYKALINAVMLAGGTNIISTLLRIILEKSKKEKVVEVIDFEEEESH